MAFSGWLLRSAIDNVYIHTSAQTARRNLAQLVDRLRTNGTRKIQFASNHPMIAPARVPDGLDELELSPESRILFLCGNAQRVYGI